MGFTDLHLHLIPGVDDGAQSLDDSLAMAQALVALGFTTVAPSPHNRPEYASRADAQKKLAELKQALAGLPLALHENAENFFLDPMLLQTAAGPEGRRVGSTQVMLVEAPYTTVLPTLPDIVFRLKVKGVTALIAHPERCLETQKLDRAKQAVQAGALLQLDIGALIGRYGETAERAARAMLDQGLYAVAATDLHGPLGAQQWLEASIAALRKGWGEKAVTALLDTGPAGLLGGGQP
jgi:protein-tyrosine phosphatase